MANIVPDITPPNVPPAKPAVVDMLAGMYERSVRGMYTQLGAIFFFGGTFMLLWNEWNFVETRTSLSEGERACVSVESVAEIDPALNGKLIHASARAEAKDALTDDLFGIDTVALALKRNIDYYQYIEHENNDDDSRTYSYSQAWVSRPIDSSNFYDDSKVNTVLAIGQSEAKCSENVAFGAYTLPRFFVERITGDVRVKPNLDAEKLAHLVKVLNGTNAVQITTNMVHVTTDRVYIGQPPGSPQIGDLRFTLTQVPSTDISIIAKVQDTTFEEFVASNKKPVSFLEMGVKGKKEIFAAAHSENTTMAWTLRFTGMLCVIGGLWGIFGIVSKVFKFLPFLRKIIHAGLALVCWGFGFAWSLLMMSSAWLISRPLIGIPLVVAAIIVLRELRKKGLEKLATPPPLPPPLPPRP